MNIPERSLDGKRAVVTGAGSGIGAACAKAFAVAGAQVALVGRSKEELDQTLMEIGGEEAGHRAVLADISCEGEMMIASEKIGADWDQLDIVVANAGINGVWAPLEQLTVDEWDQTMEINLRGTFLTVRVFLPLLRLRGGSVVVISSVNGNRIFSNSGATAYACSKAAQVAFVKMVSLELAKDRIRVNAVCPGVIQTRIHENTERRDLDDLHLPVEFPEGDVPLTDGRPGRSSDVANAVWFLASDASSHISGTEMYVDGAQSLLQG